MRTAARWVDSALGFAVSSPCRPQLVTLADTLLQIGWVRQTSDVHSITMINSFPCVPQNYFYVGPQVILYTPLDPHAKGLRPRLWLSRQKSALQRS